MGRCKTSIYDNSWTSEEFKVSGGGNVGMSWQKWRQENQNEVQLQDEMLVEEKRVEV